MLLLNPSPPPAGLARGGLADTRAATFKAGRDRLQKKKALAAMVRVFRVSPFTKRGGVKLDKASLRRLGRKKKALVPCWQLATSRKAKKGCARLRAARRKARDRKTKS